MKGTYSFHSPQKIRNNIIWHLCLRHIAFIKYSEFLKLSEVIVMAWKTRPNALVINLLNNSFLLLFSLLSHVWLFWDLTDYTPLGSSVHGISKWVAIFFSRGSSRSRDWTCVPAGRLFTSEPLGKSCKIYFWHLLILNILLFFISL